jgi:hypothetical protein
MIVPLSQPVMVSCAVCIAWNGGTPEQAACMAMQDSVSIPGGAQPRLTAKAFRQPFGGRIIQAPPAGGRHERRFGPMVI